MRQDRDIVKALAPSFLSEELLLSCCLGDNKASLARGWRTWNGPSSLLFQLPTCLPLRPHLANPATFHPGMLPTPCPATAQRAEATQKMAGACSGTPPAPCHPVTGAATLQRGQEAIITPHHPALPCDMARRHTRKCQCRTR